MGRRRVILQPAGGTEAREHYCNTIQRSVMISEMEKYVTHRDMASLATEFPTGSTRVWGVVPGANGINIRKWLQFTHGDCVLSCGQGKAFASATLRYKLHNAELAAKLWGRDSAGSTWEYVYFLGHPVVRDIPYRAIAGVAGYAPEFVVLGVNILDRDKSQALIATFNLFDD